MPEFKDAQGNVWEATSPNDPNPVFVRGPSRQMPANPTFDLERPKAQAEVESVNLRNRGQAITNEVDAATAGPTIAKANADTTKTVAEAEQIQRELEGGRPALGAKEYGDALQAFSDAAALERAADELETQFNESEFGKTKGLRGLGDYFASDETGKFNDAGQRSRGYVKRALGFTGGEGNTVAESAALYDPYLPTSWDRDARVPSKIEALRGLANDSRTKAAAALGGVPDANGKITPIPLGVPLNAMTIPRIIAGEQLSAAEFGADRTADPINPAYQAEYEQFVAQGNFTPEQYAAKRAELDRKFYGDTAQDQTDVYLKEGAEKIEGFRRGGSMNLSIPPIERDMTNTEFYRNSAVSNPAGALAAGYFDSMTLGAPSVLAGDQMGALGDKHPGYMMGGQILGAITGTGGIRKLAAEGAKRLAPRADALARLKLGKKGSEFAKNLGSDVAYSAGYTGVTEGDPLTGALYGGLGSAGGQVVGKALSGAVRGARTSPAVQRMRAMGQQPTVGQTLGGVFKTAEEKATSMPWVGDIINTRHMEGRAGFNAGGFDIGAQPVGGRVNSTGQQGIRELADIKTAAYRPLDDVTLDVAGSPIAEDVMNAQLGASGIPQGVGDNAMDALNYRVGGGMAPDGTMSGRDFQEAYRGLARDGRVTQPAGYQDEFAGAMRQGQDALATGLDAQNPGAFVDFQNANAVNRRLNVLADAVDKAKNQEDQLFTPKQLQMADASSATRLTGKINSASGNRPFAQYANDGVEVFSNNTPDSGSGGRVAQLAMQGGGLAALTGAGGGVGYAAGGQDGALSGSLGTLGTMGLLAAGGSRGGQAVLRSAIADRKQGAITVGDWLARRQGLFGASTLPYAIQN
jgi:hypothetical protein